MRIPITTPNQPPPPSAPSTEIVTRALDAAREMLDMDLAYVADTREGLQHYRYLTGDGASFGARAGRSVALEGTYCEALLAGDLAGIVTDAASDPIVKDLDITRRGRIGAYIGVPVVFSDGSLFGTVCCLSHGPEPSLRERDLRFLGVLARLIGDQLEREEYAEEHRRTAITGTSVLALLAALEARDGYTQEHSQAVVELALAVGRRLGLGELELADLEHAALLHDIGKIGVPDAILRKPGALSGEEWDHMRRHPEIGERIVASMPSLSHLGGIIRAEHESWDGTGYPDGLAGASIPLASRIVLVCDAFHAMTSDRPYRRRLSAETALDELQRCAGSQFCPDCVRAAMEVIRRQLDQPEP
jgi:response regulator RpfG family c-di-GMP phosphodiesterase